jgi:pSer/pThr/pTyr-binding forkhead associated (FHA) protein|tara:strand:+ start:347 stop:985 length:639 start_codon:yes stop_codon:yes gene_type:complete
MEKIFTIEVTFEGQSRTIELDKAEIIIGRSTPKLKVDLDLSPDGKVSRKHIKLSSEYSMASNKFEPWIKDLGSSTGTFVNGGLLDAPMKISREDEILVGETTLYVQLANKAQSKVVKEELQKPETPGSLQMGRVGKKPDEKPSPKPPSSSSVKSTILPNEAVGLVAFSVEDLAVAINRYARENKMQPIQTSIAQEDKGAKASFRALTIFTSL